MKGVIYHKDTGRIEMAVMAASEDVFYAQIVGRPELDVYFGDVDVNSVYVTPDGAALRPTMDLIYPNQEVNRPDSGIVGDRSFFVSLAPREVFKIDNIPFGAQLRYPGGECIVDDGFIEWASREPGDYQLCFSCFPYIEVCLNAIVR